MANKAKNWALVDFSGAQQAAKLRLYVAGVELPVAQFSMTYGLNAIPSATALIALGRNAQTLEESTVYQVIDAIKQMAKVRVIIEGPLGDWSAAAGTQFPSGYSVIFVGYVAGISYRRSAGRVSMVLNMLNQLIDMDMSAGGSKDVVPGAPHELLLPTLVQGAGSESAGAAGTKFVLGLNSDLTTDFSKGILNTLLYLGKNNQIQLHEGGIWCQGGEPKQLELREANTRVLETIKGVGDWEGIANNSAVAANVMPATYPLKVHAAGIEKAAYTIGEIVASSLTGTSMWNMLIGSLLPVFGCGIVPTATGAIIAPILNNAREHQVAILPAEYADFDMTTLSKRPLYGVGVSGNYQFGSLGVGENKMCVGATFDAFAEGGMSGPDGMWLFVPAPSWMDDWVNLDPQALKGEAAINQMLNKPSHDSVGVNATAVNRDPDSEVSGWNDVMQKYARLVYANNALHGRQGTLVGKLRFDIAPGTTVKVGVKDDLMSAGVDQLACDMFGFVARVTITINAEQAAAATTLELTNLRTSSENQMTRFSMTTHPFFDSNYFKYASIVPGLSLPPSK